MKKNLLLLAALSMAFTGAAPAQMPKTVKVAIEGAFPPWNALDSSGKLEGFDVDLISWLCRRAAVECQLSSGAWATLVPGLNLGKYDVVMTLGINEKRKKVVDFTLPYASGVASFLVLKNSDLAGLPMTGQRLNLNDKARADGVMAAIGQKLKGKTVGVVQSTSQEQLMNSYFGDSVKVRTYRSSAERDLDIKAGRIDAGFDSGVYARFIMSKAGNQDLTNAGPDLKGSVLATDVAMGMRKGEADLKARFDGAIKAAAAEGVIRQLSEKWSKLDLTPDYP
ncbi:transporter substrate-binding domain-containing protein [Biostraticola tofi]|uniref:ABC-type amino acid transport substrate-binding protein n=1 Tax=Biostraticola tofi TaxID=466109 RepID=A0A4R3Z3B1_9GAMM|nr:transporter substrate-binding domain-containing protein [Biostraticola tofi]TCV98343.1 ABC-type amino acid transport substrate-binding protein [Biostraticola tofi]